MVSPIKKNNVFNEAHFSLSIAEYRIILMCIYVAKKSRANAMTDRIRFHVDEFAELFNINRNGSDAYNMLDAAGVSLKQKIFLVREPDPILKDKIRTSLVSWMSECSYIEKTGFFEFMFSQRMAEYIQDLDARYTLYDLEMLAKLNSFYSMRIFEMMMQWRSTGKTQTFRIQDVKHKLGIGLMLPDGTMLTEDKYEEMRIFTQSVIKRSLKNINDNTDLNAKYETIKVGKSVVGCYFTFNKDAKAVLAIKDFQDETEIDVVEELDEDGLPKLGF